MSLAAAEYYQSRANRLDLGLIPELLEGEPILLLGQGPGEHLSLQGPNQQTLDAVTNRYARVTAPAAEFVIKAFSQQRPDIPKPEVLPTKQRNMFSQHCTSVFTKLLFPAYLKAGRISDIQIEALARNEVEGPFLNKACTTYGGLGKSKREDTEVYLLTTAALRAGRHLGYASCLTVVTGSYTPENAFSYDSRSGNILYAHYTAAADRRNNLLAKSGLEQSRAIRNVIDAYGIQNEIVQPVMRSQSDRGHRLR